MKSKKIAFSALIAAIYFGLVMLLQPIAFGPLQFRISEALTIMPIFGIEGIIGVTLGCLLSNIFSSYGIYDIVFGTLATVIAAVLTRVLRKRILLSFFMPVIINALALPLIWFFLGTEQLYIINAALIFASQAVIIYGFGLPLYIALLRTPYFDNDKSIKFKSCKLNQKSEDNCNTENYEITKSILNDDKENKKDDKK